MQGETCGTLGSKLCVSWWASPPLKGTEGAGLAHPSPDHGAGQGAAHGTGSVQPTDTSATEILRLDGSVGRWLSAGQHPSSYGRGCALPALANCVFLVKPVKVK